VRLILQWIECKDYLTTPSLPLADRQMVSCRMGQEFIAAEYHADRTCCCWETVTW